MVESDGVDKTTVEGRFAENMRELRTDRLISQESLAKRMAEYGYKWHQATVYKVETGARQVQLGEARAIAEILQVPLDKMTEDAEDAIETLRGLQALIQEFSDCRWDLAHHSVRYEELRQELKKRLDIEGELFEETARVFAYMPESDLADVKVAIAVKAIDISANAASGPARIAPRKPGEHMPIWLY